MPAFFGKERLHEAASIARLAGGLLWSEMFRALLELFRGGIG
jgi:hypothetical protein